MTQAPGICQYAATSITGLAANRVNVTSRRAGGGFGGKLTRQMPIVAAAALGSFVTGKQVHVQLERCQDLMMTGAREDIYCEYQLGLDAKGVITGLKTTFYTNGGCFIDNAPGV